MTSSAPDSKPTLSSLWRQARELRAPASLISCPLDQLTTLATTIEGLLVREEIARRHERDRAYQRERAAARKAKP